LRGTVEYYVLPQHSQQQRRQATSWGTHAACLRILAWCSLSISATWKALCTVESYSTRRFISETMVLGRLVVLARGVTIAAHRREGRGQSVITRVFAARNLRSRLAERPAAVRLSDVPFVLCDRQIVPAHCLTALLCSDLRSHPYIPPNGATELRFCMIIARHTASSRSESGALLSVAAACKRARRSEARK
jgi:hypothetical protein